MKHIVTILIAALLLCACSRDGFAAAMQDRDTPPPSVSEPAESEPAASDAQSVLPPVEKIELESREHEEPGVYISYAVPTSTGEQKQATDAIAKCIDEVIKQVPTAFSMGEKGAKLEVYDNVTKNGDGRFSVLYEGNYFTDKLPKGRRFSFGLTFNLKTGTQMGVEKVMAPHSLAALILDEQSSKLLEKDEAIAQKQRAELADKGLTYLAEMIVAAEPQTNIDHLLTFSYYLTSDQFIVLIPVAPEAGDLAMIEIPNA